MISPSYNNFLMLANCQDEIDRALIKVAECIYLEPNKVFDDGGWRQTVLNDLAARLSVAHNKVGKELGLPDVERGGK